MKKTKLYGIKVGNLKIGQHNPFFLIAGPCVIETERKLYQIASNLKEITHQLNVPFIFKASYDKANRSSIKSYRGPGLVKGLKILQRIKTRLRIPVLSDVHCQSEVKPAARVLDIIQIPALLSRQTSLILAAARTRRPINIKKAQFMAPQDITNIIAKITSTGNHQIIITERGTCFGYHQLVNDMRAIPIMKSLGYPVAYDASHSVQLPSGAGECSSGERAFIPYLAQAAVAAGCDGLFLEVHPRPDQALCDGPNMLKLDDLARLLEKLTAIHEIVK